MGLKTVLIGSTGLIGSRFLECLEVEDDLEVKAITRTITSLDNKDFIKQSVHDFKDNEKIRTELNTDILLHDHGRGGLLLDRIGSFRIRGPHTHFDSRDWRQAPESRLQRPTIETYRDLLISIE